ncbi:zinc finger BED domain-containing protein RICESLEEPER 2-like [Tripterygium wilfordii]|uniref:zinc finger BED domain-containing protein RICESLEEPER 2-like n=1 Tax=Tripterygium wilfordii TaxID=458696 RepID=UPI0018F82AE9|nr:zinc finger BED domain-containing protein RICESLEEPER 2-like [Tripterygium wilfordii]
MEEGSSQTPSTSTPPSVSESGIAAVGTTEPEDTSTEKEVEAAGTLPPRPGKKKSIVWDHFETMVVKGKGKRAVCNHCKHDYACNTTVNGTSTLRTHLLHYCPNSPIKEDKSQKTLSFEGKGNLVAHSFSKERSTLACVEMVIIDELPFRFVEGIGFKRFMKEVQPRFDPPSRSTVARKVWSVYLDRKATFKSIISSNNQRVSLTTDTWTSIQNVNYMALTAHFIDDDWKLHKRILNFCQITNHKGDAIGRLIERCLSDWGIERVFTITVDNASANDGAIRYVARQLRHWKTLLFEGNLLHMRCCAHIINLIVSDGLSEMHSSIKSIRKACKYTRSSPSWLEKFRQCLVLEKIDSKGLMPLECKTRWNSIYLMLEAALKVQRAFERLEEETTDYVRYFDSNDDDDDDENQQSKRRRVDDVRRKLMPPSASDWSYARVFVKFLKKFYDATLKLSSYKTVTANVPFREIYMMADALKKAMRSDDEFLKKVATSMKTKFDKYWGNIKDVNQVVVLAVVLDPRYKMDLVQWGFEFLEDEPTMIEGLVFRVKTLLFNMYEDYKKDTPGVAQWSMDATNENEGDVNEEEGDANLEMFMRRRKERDGVQIRNEVDKYLLEAAENPKNLAFNLLDWWKENQLRYPILSKIVRDIFAAPMSSVPSESAFSAGKRVVNPFRACLSPKTVEALICCNDWI